MLKILLYISVVVSFVFSAPVSNDTALQVAQNTFIKYHESKNINNFDLKKIDTIDLEGEPVINIYQLNPKGFIMVALEDKSTPVLAYGFDSEFKLENIPTNLSYMMDLYKNKMDELRSSNAERSSEVEEEWNSILLNNNDGDNNSTRNVSPLIDAEFDQSGGWNNTLTAETGFNGPLGCVAISMGQIMHYWGYPEQGEGSNYYMEDDLGMLEADFGQTVYDFDNMAATYATNPSRLLLYHCGIAVNMDYEYGGSGAQCQGVYPSAEYAMKTFFKYGENIQSIYSDNYDNVADFRNVLKNELDQNKPILFSGFSDSYGNGGHAWNIDGYQGNNLHCNWGWGGYSNGYYSLPSLNGFDTWQNALINLIPETYANPFALFEYEVMDMDVVFIDLSEVINESEIDSWTWNYGDGTSETNSYGFTNHTYTNPGEYEATLTVTNIYGQVSEPHTELITIGNPVLPGDVNLDETINILDVVMVINFVLGSDSPNNSEFSAGDYNNDGYLNVQDIVLIINLILD